MEDATACRATRASAASRYLPEWRTAPPAPRPDPGGPLSASTAAARTSEFLLRVGRDVARDLHFRIDAPRYHLQHGAEAGRAYDTLCAHDPGRRLDGRTRRRIREYAREVLGSRLYAPWLRVYAAWAGEFREGWMPDNYYGRVVHGSPPGLSDHKTLSRRLLGTDLIPDLAYRLGGTWVGIDGTPVPAADVDDYVFAAGPTVVAKFDGSLQGLGVHVVRSGEASLLDLPPKGDLVVQRFIRQAPFFARFLPDNVAAVRITTVRTPDLRAHTRASYLKFGRAGQRSYTSERGLIVAIVDDHGTLAERGIDHYWNPIPGHLDSGEAFAGKIVPSFAAACRAVEALHERIPQVEVIGWDVVIDDEGRLQIMEWNDGHSGIRISEAHTGPCFLGLGWENRWKR